MADRNMSEIADNRTAKHVPKTGHSGHIPLGMSGCPVRLRPGGWRCVTCHPLLHLSADAVRQTTTEPRGKVGIAPTSESPNILLIKGTAA